MVDSFIHAPTIREKFYLDCEKKNIAGGNFLHDGY